MKKRFLTFVIALVTMLSGMFSLVGCKEKATKSQLNSVVDSQSSAHENGQNKELQVINMFETFGSYSDDVYRFRKYDTVGNCNFLYTFSYSPAKKLYYCAVLTTTNGYYNMYDYGAITFSWDDIKNALFCGYHELEKIAIIEISFSNVKLNSNISLDNSYSYQVTKNTFVNLTKKEDIDDYASNIFECMNRSIGYAQSILYTYTDNITLW